MNNNKHASPPKNIKLCRTIIRKVCNAASRSYHPLVFIMVVSSVLGCSASISKCEFYEISSNSASISSEKFGGECSFLFANHNRRYIITKDSFQISITNSGRWFPRLYAGISPSDKFQLREDSTIRLDANPEIINDDPILYNYSLILDTKGGARTLYIVKTNSDKPEAIIDSVEIRYKLNKGRFISMDYI